MISSSFAVFALLSKVKSAALQKMKPGLLSADPTKSNNVFSCFPFLTLLNKTQIDRVFQFCNHLHIKLLQLVFLDSNNTLFCKTVSSTFFFNFFRFLSCLQQHFCHPGKNTGVSLYYNYCRIADRIDAVLEDVWWKPIVKIGLRLRLFLQYPSLHCYKLGKEI